ncbi:hypothetical protein ADILRU_0431 [Leifsonia rubra CMS 76R]|nr:hypothetical protein ADILRU_0431 [Leifsonia rubra CMS 76R]
MRKVVFVWVDHPAVDWFLLAFCSVAMLIFSAQLGAALMVKETTLVTIFQSTAGTAATLAGFTFAGIAFLLGQLAATLDKLDRHWKKAGAKQIKSLVFKPFIFLSLTFVFSLGVVLVSAVPGLPRRIVIALAIGALLASASALGRNLWILSRLARS